MFNVLKSAPEQCQMVECYVFVAEVIVFLRNAYLIAAFTYTHSRQSSLRIRLPWVQRIHFVLASADLAQVPDAVVEAVAVDVVYLQHRKPPVVPSPNGAVHEDMIKSAIDVSTHRQITMFAVFFTVFLPSHHAVRLGIHKQSAAVVVIIILLDASRQCGQLAIR